MKLYIDNDFKCHVSNDGTRQEIETEFFDGKCKRFIEGYRYLPEGETWTRADGEVFTGLMISPCVNSNILMEFQAQDDEHTAELAEFIEEIFNSDLEVIDNV